jgi:ATP-dependent protease ClpP protease subunit
METSSEDSSVADIYIMDEIGGWWGVTASDFVKELMAIDATQINLHLNSPGGDVFDGVTIYNSLRMHSATVKVYVEGLAASAASFIAQAGDEVIMLRGSTMMIHDASAMAWGDEATMLTTAGILNKISNNIADIYAQRAGGSMEAWRDIMREEAWYTPDEAVAAKLADKVDDAEDKDAQAKAKVAWDLGVFNYAGRSKAPDPLEQMLQITNRAKEAPVTGKKTTPSNEGENENPTPEAPAAPEAPTTEPVEPGADPQDDDTPPAAQPVDPPTTTAPANSTSGGATIISFMVNGVAVTDLKAVQAHIVTLETTQRESKAQARKDFINGLASGNSPKILASQIEPIEKLVESMSDEQYSMWVASWDAAPGASLLAPHGGGGGGTPSGTAAEAAADRVEILKGILSNHLAGGMKPEKIEATASFNELKKLEPDFTLDTLKK